MKCKIPLFISTGICLGIGVVAGASSGLIGLIILNILIGVFQTDSKAVKHQQNKKQQNQQRQPKESVDTIELTQNVIAACTDIIHDYKRIPAYIVYDKQKMVEIGIMTKYRRFIPLFKMVKNKIVPLTQMIDDEVPEMLMQTVQIEQQFPQVMPPPQQPQQLPPDYYNSYPQGDNYYGSTYQNQPQRRGFQPR